MRLRSFSRTLFSQIIALTGCVIFLVLMWANVPSLPRTESDDGYISHTADVFLAREPEQTKPEAVPEEEPQPAPVESERTPSRPERFRPAAKDAPERPTDLDVPPAAARTDRDTEVVPSPRRELPLSYLMNFEDINEFHSFLEKLPDDLDPDRTMSIIRIKGLPRTVSALRSLFESYHMEPFLFNPDRFNYLITDDGRLMRDRSTIRNYIAEVGRYLHEEGSNAAYDAIRNQAISAARADGTIRDAITDEAEFDRMQLGLASAHLGRFLRQLERDTARQVSELAGREIGAEDIARIDCRFEDVNGAMVLVPRTAWLGTQSGGESIQLWQE